MAALDMAIVSRKRDTVCFAEVSIGGREKISQTRRSVEHGTRALTALG